MVAEGAVVDLAEWSSAGWFVQNDGVLPGSSCGAFFCPARLVAIELAFFRKLEEGGILDSEGLKIFGELRCQGWGAGLAAISRSPTLVLASRPPSVVCPRDSTECCASIQHI